MKKIGKRRGKGREVGKVDRGGGLVEEGRGKGSDGERKRTGERKVVSYTQIGTSQATKVESLLVIPLHNPPKHAPSQRWMSNITRHTHTSVGRAPADSSDNGSSRYLWLGAPQYRRSCDIG